MHGMGRPVGLAGDKIEEDPLLQPGLLEKVGLEMDGKKVDPSKLKPQEWERLRTGIALKTFTALIKRYQVSRCGGVRPIKQLLCRHQRMGVVAASGAGL